MTNLNELAKRMEPTRHVPITEEVFLSFQRLFGNKTPGQVYDELTEAYAEIERLKALTHHSGGKSWSEAAIQDRLLRTRVEGYLRVLVYGATRTREIDSWEADCKCAEFIHNALPDIPETAMKIAEIVGADQAMKQVLSKKSAQSLRAVADGKETIRDFDKVVQAAVDAVPASQAHTVRDALVTHYVNNGYKFVLHPSGEEVPPADISVWDYHGEMVVMVVSDPKDAA